jgi:hypothetical protein
MKPRPGARPREDRLMPTITRRYLIVGGTSAATFAVGLSPAARTAETITVDEFRRLSAKLTGIGLASLDARAAGKLLDGFVSLGLGSDLAVLAADPAASTGKLANDVVAAWYSGRAGAATIELNQALVWKVLDFTKPTGECGGETGYWAQPYQN